MRGKREPHCDSWRLGFVGSFAIPECNAHVLRWPTSRA
jgi:hypothetical protein